MKSIFVKIAPMASLVYMAVLFVGCNNKKTTAQDESSVKETSVSMATTSKSSSPNDLLIGEYAAKPNGEAQFRISKVNGSFLAEIYEKGIWSPPTSIHAASNEKLTELFGKSMVQHIEVGMVSKDIPFGIFKVGKELKIAGDKVNSDYVAILLLPIQVYKL